MKKNKIENQINELQTLIENQADLETIRMQARKCKETITTMENDKNYDLYVNQYNNIIKSYNKTKKQERKKKSKQSLARATEIVNKINEQWNKMCTDFYVCYSVKELAYTIAEKITDLLEKDYDYMGIDYKYDTKAEKHKIIFEIDNYMLEEKEIHVYFTCDIWWVTGMFGDSGLKIGNGKIATKIPQGYEDIESAIPEEEEEE